MPNVGPNAPNPPKIVRTVTVVSPDVYFAYTPTTGQIWPRGTKN